MASPSRPVTLRPVLCRLIVPALLMTFGVLGFLWMLDAMRHGTGISAADPAVHEWAMNLRTPWLTGVLAIITTAAAPFWFTVIVIVVTLAWGFVQRQWWRPVLLALSMLMVAVLSSSLKHAVQRHRPPISEMMLGPLTTPAFPSGHSLAAGVFFSVVAYLLLSRRRSPARIVWMAVLALVGTVLVAFSRIYLGYHWLSDVTSSLFLTVAVLGAVIAIDQFRPAATDGHIRKTSTPEAGRKDPQAAPVESIPPRSARDPR